MKIITLFLLSMIATACSNAPYGPFPTTFRVTPSISVESRTGAPRCLKQGITATAEWRLA